LERGSDLVRALVAADVPAALELSSAAGWNQTAEDWQRLIDLDPDGCFGIDCDGGLIATATLLGYGRDLGWIGMVLTHRDHRRHGLARRLCERTIQEADRRGIRCLKLDATDQGLPLYAALGFEEEQPIERWRREATPATGMPSEARIDPALDRAAFGADRSRFLEALNFRMHRPGSRAHYLGPCIARNAATAGSILRALVNGSSEAWFWDLFPLHPHAPALARELGFAPVRRLTRMMRGERIQIDNSLVYAIGGFEAG
jgi:GNAT superfamily N-acetyltransferase